MRNKQSIKSIFKVFIVSSILMGGQFSYIKNSMIVHAEENVSPADNTQMPSIDEMRKMFEKMNELAQAGVNDYIVATGEAIGSEAKKVFANPNSTQEELYNILLEVAQYGITGPDGQVINPQNLAEFEPFLNNDYQKELTKQKNALKEEINKSNVSDELKQKFTKLVDEESSINKVRTEISNKFEEAKNQDGRYQLETAKENAKNEINIIPYLQNREYFKQLVDNASSIQEVEKHVQDAKEKAKIDEKNHKEIEEITKKINALPYLTSDEKARYNLLLDKATVEEARNYLKEAEAKNNSNNIDRLLGLVNTIKNQLPELEKLPKYPNTPDYEVQEELWSSIIDTVKNSTKTTRSQLESLTPERLRKTSIDLSDNVNYIRIEAMTRQVAEIRKKYPNNAFIEGLFRQFLKQEKNNNYASQSGGDLTKYANDAENMGLNKIKEIVSNINKKDEAVKQIDELIKKVEASKKPNSEPIIDELKKQKEIIKSISENLVNIENLIKLHLDPVKKQAEDFLGIKSVVEKEETVIEEVNYPTERILNSSLPKGQSRLKVKGEKGSSRVTYKVTYTEGKVTSRKEISRVVIKAPVKEVIEVGTKEEANKNNKPESNKTNVNTYRSVPNTAESNSPFVSMVIALSSLIALVVIRKKYINK